jgi:hypothetical protein
MARQEIMADDYRPLPGQESTGGKKITLGDLISLLSRNSDNNTPMGSRSDDYRNLSSGVNLTPQSFGLEYRQPTTPVQPQAKVFDMPAVRREQPEDSRMTTDSMSFGDAFRTYRDMMGPGAVFIWRGKPYTTDMSTDTQAPTPAPVDTLRSTPVRVQSPVTTLPTPAPVDTLRSTTVPVDATIAQDGGGQTLPPIDMIPDMRDDITRELIRGKMNKSALLHIGRPTQLGDGGSLTHREHATFMPNQRTPQMQTTAVNSLLGQLADAIVSDILLSNGIAVAAQPDSMTYATGPVVSHIPVQSMPDPSSPFTRRYPVSSNGPERQIYRFTGEQPRPIHAAETFDDPYINPFAPVGKFLDYLEPNLANPSFIPVDAFDREARARYQASLGRDYRRLQDRQRPITIIGPTHTSSY